MSIIKIAEAANVSKATVSKVMNDSSEISLSTKQRVIAAAKELGCYEKYYKGGDTKKIIAVVCPEVASEFYSSALSCLEKTIAERGAAMAVYLSNFNAKTESEMISLGISKGRADGVIVLDALSNITAPSAPLVAINSMREQKNVDCVSTDYYSPIFEAIYQFKINGHKKIGFIGESLTQDKFEYFKRAMKEHRLNINENYIEISKYRFLTAGYLAMEKLFEKGDMPTAILAAYDYIALGMLQSIQSRGKKVPDDFSVIGIDNISFDDFDNISLTSVKANIHEVCDIALELLFKKMENKYYKIIQSITVKGALILRNSVKKLT